MGRDQLGELEHQILLALLRLGEDAYTAPIVVELEDTAGRPTSLAAVYIVLRRLEDKGLVASELRDPGEGGGRDRRYFRVTDPGLERLREVTRAYDRLRRGLDGVLGVKP
jgi:DNA-binding PadR family transcriptional regulator